MKVLICILVTIMTISCYPPNIEIPRGNTITYKMSYPWEVGTVYNKGDTATRPAYTQNGPIYQSIVDNNQNIEPPAVFQPEDVFYGHEDQFGVTPNWQNYWERIR